MRFELYRAFFKYDAQCAVHAGGQPDVMASCTRPLHLGVVDSYSFEGSELEVRKALFGEKAPPATQVDTPDRTGFLYAPREGLAMGVLPDNDRVQVVWALGSGDLSDGVRAVLQASTFAQPHTPAVGDQISYYVHHRPLSPVVLCPVGCLCAVGAVVIGLVAVVVLLRSRRRPSDDEDDA